MTTFLSNGGTIILFKVSCAATTSNHSFVSVNASGTAILQSCVFNNINISDVIIYPNNSIARVNECSFLDMYRDYDAGVGTVLSVLGECEITLTRCNFINVGDIPMSGVMRVSADGTASNLTIIDCIFTNCSGSLHGGAFRIHSCKFVNISNTEFNKCRSPKGGAIIVVGSLSLNLLNVTFDLCVSSTSGGGILFNVSTATFTCEQSTFSSCSCSGNGGGICFEKGSAFTITDSTFFNCSSEKAGAYGGAMYVGEAVNGMRILTNIVFKDNLVRIYRCILFKIIYNAFLFIYFIGPL
jgi:parallel beta-helix repeat protein